MVRLKAVIISSYMHFENSFQFQYGAIKSFTDRSGWSTTVVFQFQYGAIKSSIEVTNVSELIEISIPVWCD